VPQKTKRNVHKKTFNSFGKQSDIKIQGITKIQK